MKTIATLLILALASTSLAANCTADNACVACNADGKCTKNYQAFTGTDGAKVAYTVANCVVGTAADACTQCAPTFGLISDGGAIRTSVTAGECLAITSDGQTALANHADCGILGVAANADEASDVWTCTLCTNNKGNTSATDICSNDTPAVTNCLWLETDATSTANACKGCATTHTLNAGACSDERKDALAGCFETTATDKCTTACDGSASWWATSEGVCTQSSFAKIAGVFAVVALFFANF